MNVKTIICLAVIVILASMQPAQAISYEELGVFFPGLLVNTITGYFSLVTGYGAKGGDEDEGGGDEVDEVDSGSSGSSSAATEDKFDSDTLKLPPPPPSGINPLVSTTSSSESTATLPPLPESTRPVKEKTIVEFPSTVNCDSDVQKLQFPKYCGAPTTPLPPPPPPPAPTAVDPSIQRARKEQRRRSALKTGLAGPIKTPALLDDASVANKTLLGG